ncbi:MAG: RsmD family RNA methyltransferase, partial [candidate division WOR-3 bacterium]
MRIIGGDKKGFKLRLVAKKSRPTLAKVREAIFNILGPEVVGANVLDLFCGSGALGIEALSRGAKSATFIDRDTRSLITNIKEINFKNVVIIKSDVFRAVKKLPQQNFDIIFL